MDLLPVSDQPDFLKMLVYGRPDSGKTTFGASGVGHPEFSPTVIMDIEGGLESVRWGGALKTPRIDTPEDIEKVIIAAANRQGGFADAKVLVVDSLTKMAKILLQGIVAKKHAIKPRRGGLDQIELSDYGDLGKAVERYVDMLIGLNMHVVFIALEKELKSDDVVTGITLNLPGGLPAKIIAACDNVWALKKITPTDGDASVVMLTQQAGLQFARVRNEQFREELGGGIENPTLPAIWETYQRALAKGRAKLEGQNHD